ncbi:MAG: biotin--[acetyl-CoA-carboxylase] ligase [Leeuwenhoekiella sp.]
MLKVKISATPSTSSYLRQYSREQELTREVLVWTDNQYNGRGQQGAYWESEPYKNLTLSVFKQVNGLGVDKQFHITMATSLALWELLIDIGIEDVAVKWPNDILSGGRKICGILIESVVRSHELQAVIIGIGLNVNQTEFMRAPRATSVKLETGKALELEPLLDMVVQKFQHYINLVTLGKFVAIKKEYEEVLFRKEAVSVFQNPKGNFFNAIIKGVTRQGKLLLQMEDDSIMEFDSKEAVLQY